MASVSSLRKQIETLPSGHRQLNIDGQILERITSDIVELTDVHDFIFRRNKLLDIPLDFGCLTQIRILDLSHNLLNVFPVALLQLKSLEKLNLSYNKLTSLPNEIAIYSELRVFEVDLNRIGSLPDGLCHCTSLEQVSFGGNVISDLPTNFFNLISLKKLYLDSNLFEELPEQVTQFINLEHLFMGHNRLQSIPESISELKNLVELRLNSNKLKTLPSTICNLKKLSLLHIENNKITTIPFGVGELKNLDQFYVSNNPLVQPPLEVCKLGIVSISDYQEKLLENEETIPPRLKLVALGPNLSGKTSCLETLVRNEPRVTKAEERTHGLDISTWLSNGARFELYDFSGNHMYHFMLQFFITPSSLYLVVIDLIQCNIDEFDDTIGFWLNFIHTCAPGSVICIVGTYMESFGKLLRKVSLQKKCKEIIQYIQQWEDTQCRELVAEIDLIDSVLMATGHVNSTHPLVGLSRDSLVVRRKYVQSLLINRPKISCNIIQVCSDEGSSGINELKSQLNDVVNNAEVFPHQRTSIPSTWANLEKLLIEQRKTVKIWIDMSDIVILAQSTGLTAEYLKPALQYLKQVGTILYYPDIPELEERVFHNPTKLCEIFKSVFNHDLDNIMNVHDIRFKHYNPWQFHKLRQVFSQRGLLPADLLSVIIKPTLQGGVCEDDVISVLHWFSICKTLHETELGVQSTLNGLDKDWTGVQILYRFPWYVTDSLPDEISQRWPEYLPLDCEQLEIGCDFRFHCPPGLFERLSVKLHSHVELRRDWTHGIIAMRQNMPLLIQQVVRGDEAHSISIGSRGSLNKVESMWSVILPVMDELLLLLQEYTGLYYHTYIACAHCYKKGLTKPHHFPGELLYQTPPVKPTVVCPKAKRSDVVKPELVYPPSTELDINLHRNFKVIQRHLTLRHWRKFGHALGLTDTKLDEIRHEYTHFNDQCYQMMLRWRREYRNKATLPSLISTLETSGLSNITNQFIESSSISSQSGSSDSMTSSEDIHTGSECSPIRSADGVETVATIIQPPPPPHPGGDDTIQMWDSITGSQHTTV